MLKGLVRLHQDYGVSYPGMNIIISLLYIIIFGAGMYTGVYVAQNYQIDKVEDPKVLFNKVCDMIKEKFDDIKSPKEK